MVVFAMLLPGESAPLAQICALPRLSLRAVAANPREGLLAIPWPWLSKRQQGQQQPSSVS